MALVSDVYWLVRLLLGSELVWEEGPRVIHTHSRVSIKSLAERVCSGSRMGDVHSRIARSKRLAQDICLLRVKSMLDEGL